VLTGCPVQRHTAAPHSITGAEAKTQHQRGIGAGSPGSRYAASPKPPRRRTSAPGGSQGPAMRWPRHHDAGHPSRERHKVLRCGGPCRHEAGRPRARRGPAYRLVMPEDRLGWRADRLVGRPAMWSPGPPRRRTPAPRGVRRSGDAVAPPATTQDVRPGRVTRSCDVVAPAATTQDVRRLRAGAPSHAAKVGGHRHRRPVAHRCRGGATSGSSSGQSAVQMGCATIAVQPVWCEAPRPAPVSP
jgi:hypothetical protein